MLELEEASVLRLRFSGRNKDSNALMPNHPQVPWLFILPPPTIAKDKHVGDLSSIPGLGRSPGEGKGYPLQYSDLENSKGCKKPDMTEPLSLHFT